MLNRVRRKGEALGRALTLRGKPKVLILGTCRIFDPLKILEARGDLRVLPRAWGHVHSTTEILHMLALARGERTPPSLEQAEMLNLPGLRERSGRMRRDVEDADVAVIEVSSLKTYRVGDHATQVNALADATGIHAFDIDRWLRTGMRGKLTDAEVGMLAEVRAEIETLEEMEHNLEAVLDSLEGVPVILVNHFVMARPCHAALFVREDIRDVVARLAKDRQGVTWFDPTPLLVAKDYPVTDSSHYKEEFKNDLADTLSELITGVLA